MSISVLVLESKNDYKLTRRKKYFEPHSLDVPHLEHVYFFTPIHFQMQVCSLPHRFFFIVIFLQIGP